MVFSNWREVDNAGHTTIRDVYASRGWFPHARGESVNQVSLPVAAARRWFFETSPCPSSAVVMRRSQIKHLWNPRIRVGEDRLFLLLNLIANDRTVGVLLEPSWGYRTHGANSCQNHPRADLLAFRDNRSLREIEGSVSGLTREERRLLRVARARNYADWGYYLSTRSRMKRAAVLLRRSFRLAPGYIPLKMLLGNSWRRLFTASRSRAV